MKLAQTLLALRQYHRLKAKAVAAGLGFSPGHISELEHGRKIPTLDCLDRYARFFDLPTSSIVWLAENYGSPAGSATPHPTLLTTALTRSTS